jgi:hypothetical protein
VLISSSSNLSYLYALHFVVPRQQKWFLVPLVPSASACVPISELRPASVPTSSESLINMGTLGHTYYLYRLHAAASRCLL